MSPQNEKNNCVLKEGRKNVGGRGAQRRARNSGRYLANNRQPIAKSTQIAVQQPDSERL